MSFCFRRTHHDRRYSRIPFPLLPRERRVDDFYPYLRAYWSQHVLPILRYSSGALKQRDRYLFAYDGNRIYWLRSSLRADELLRSYSYY